MPEVITVVAVAGVIAGIAIPATVIQERTNSTQAVRSDLRIVDSAVSESLARLRGAPPGALNVCHSSATWPVATRPAGTCADGAWSAVLVSNGAALDPPLSGRLTPGVSLQGRIAADGSYCLDATRAGSSGAYFRIDSVSRQVKDGSCMDAAWVASGGQTGSTGVTTTTVLPGAPTGVAVAQDTGLGVARVRWTAVSGKTYLVQVTGYPAKRFTATSSGTASCTFPATSCADNTQTGTMPAGKYTASVREATTDGQGPESLAVFAVLGNSEVIASKVDMTASLVAAPVAVVASSRTNLAVNPSMETGVGSWTGGGCSGTDLASGRAVPAAAGVSYGIATAVTACNSRVYLTDNGNYIPVVAGQVYTFTAYSRADGTPRQFDLLVDWLDASKTYVSYVETTELTDTTTGWTRHTLTATVPAGISYAHASIRWIGVNAAERHFFDGVMFEKASAADEYFDGSTSKFALWTAGAHASSSILNVAGAKRGRVKVSWQEPAAAAGQRVTYTVMSNPGQLTCRVTAATSCYVSGLDDDTSYTFTVTASTKSGAGLPGTSNAVVTAPAPQTAASPPSEPLALTATPVLTGKVRLNWTAPRDSGGVAITDYIIEQRTSNGWVTIDDGVGSGLTATVSGLAAGTYSFRVTARNVVGASAPSTSIVGQAGYPPDPLTVFSGPTYNVTSGTVVLVTNAPPAGTTFVTGYSTSATLTSSTLPAGTSAISTCGTSTCTHTWTGFQSRQGTKWYFYVYPKTDTAVGSGSPATSAAPDAANAMNWAVAGTFLECPPNTTEVAGGLCREYTPYTYTETTNTYTVTIVDECQYVANWWTLVPVPPHTDGCVWTRTHTEQRTEIIRTKNATPAGWSDDGTQWYRDLAKRTLYLYKLVPKQPWTDAGIGPLRFGEVWRSGVLLTEGESGSLGRCPGSIAFELRGIGGTATGSLAFPCN